MRYIDVIAYTEWHTADIPQRFFNEIRVCNLLHGRDTGLAPFVGVYSTAVHQMALIYEYMDGLDLKHYLRNEANAGKLKLVPVPLHVLSILRMDPLTLLDNN